ncbi:hypothetical protein LXA43DRAFT_1119741 [Ganoderma leucocontextum]|nr:hypothetical protein LXA43DRAFT_1119741 [Ganoderma leucocontextum]
MQSTSRDLTFILQTYLSPDFTLDPRQPALTGWSKSLQRSLQNAAQDDISFENSTEEGLGEEEAEDTSQGMHHNVNLLYDLLGISPNAITAPSILPLPPLVLCTTHVECIICDAAQPRHSLRRRILPQTVKVLTSDLRWREAALYIAHCIDCQADYYPDSITYPMAPNSRARRQRFDYTTRYLRVSKHGIWAERRIAWMQEHTLVRFHTGWSNFANWINDLLPHEPLITYRQSQCLFLEHFSRRLLIAHGKHENFSIPAHPNSATLAEVVRECIGVNGGVLPSAKYHGCTECTHIKRYYTDLIHEGAIPQEVNLDAVVEVEVEDEQLGAAPDGQLADQGLPPDMPPPPQVHQAAPAGQARGYVRLAVMDGKTITHQKCAFDDCRNPLIDYRQGRFCADHLEARGGCGIVACGQPAEPGEVTCDLNTHHTWYSQWQQQAPANAEEGGHRPSLQVQLPALEGTPGNEVVHTFRAKTTYCLETIQWSCGMPIGWGKCYKSESSSQVLDILNRTWSADQHHLCPSFIVFDDACDLLCHIVTQNSGDTWIETTKFIVDAWHYIGHKSTDILCRLFCNPAPGDGSQPDLVGTVVDANDQTHLVRAFITETAEQFNAWLSGYEGLMRSMTDVNYDFFVHVLFLVYSEEVEERMRKQN